MAQPIVADKTEKSTVDQIILEFMNNEYWVQSIFITTISS